MTVAKIDRTQYFFMIPNVVFGKAIGITAGVMVRKIGVDLWLSMLIGFVIGIALILIMTYLCSKFPEKTIIQFSEEILGKWIGKLLGILLFLFFIMAFGASANVMTLHLNEYFLPETPFSIVCILYTLLCMYGILMGVEIVLRFALIGFIMVVMITLTMVTGTVENLEPMNLMPILDNGILPSILKSYYIFGDIGLAILSIGFFYPMLNNKQKVYKITFWSMIIGTVLVIIWPIYEIMVLGPNLMKQYVVVCMQQIRCAQLTKYLPRYELIMVSFFTFTVFVQSSAMFYCAKHCIKQVTGIKKDWTIVLPLTLILIIITYYMGVDDNQYINFLTFPYSQICAIFSIGLPIILLLIALFRGKLKNKSNSG